MTPQLEQITELLNAWGDGDASALDKLLPLVEAELRRLARHYMRGEREGHLLQTTALVNEAYLRLIDQNGTKWQNRAHFFGIAARLMRRILVDHARAEQREKRGGHARPVPLSQAEGVGVTTAGELIALDEALERLAALDERKARVVELRYFGGLSVEETAEVLHVSPVTVMRDWGFARSWLRREIGGL
jgi:RNA polymerase sigma factor (TIGR02999 family)